MPQNNVNPHVRHRARMRERFRRNGLSGFEAHEIIEMLLYYSVPRNNTNIIAHELCDKFHGLARVIEAPISELKTVKGVGEESATFIAFIKELIKAYTEDKNSNGNIMDSLEKIGEYFKSKYIGENQEISYIMCLDNKKSLISCDMLSIGSAISNEISVRKAAEISLRANAATVIIAHNHPIGEPIPSRADIISTIDLRKALKLIGVSLVDHIIVGNGRYVSLAKSGIFLRED